MNPSIEALFTDKIVAEAAKRYGFIPDELILLGKNQNFTYGSNNEAQNFVIRIIHESHRTLELIQGELEWIQYLANNGVPVSFPVESSNGELIEKMNGFFVVAFQKGLGAPWSMKYLKMRNSKNWGHLLEECTHSLKNTFLVQWRLNDTIGRIIVIFENS
ncbi:aminoglycoside phosphotransferase/kinase family protein [Paenibacillus selenitireducens]|uniref:hypothetical protein n=1 Tax=Paenibacillus selenitireducens TaxID=1324314 RepID=UPI001301EAF9|nr:hypothetical protein [Paenibacillus selenitireducens]